jgi:hypothetical protein
LLLLALPTALQIWLHPLLLLLLLLFLCICCCLGNCRQFNARQHLPCSSSTCYACLQPAEFSRCCSSTKHLLLLLLAVYLPVVL